MYRPFSDQDNFWDDICAYCGFTRGSHRAGPPDNLCPGHEGRMDWEALGYPGDPIRWGSRERVRNGDSSLKQPEAE